MKKVLSILFIVIIFSFVKCEEKCDNKYDLIEIYN